MLLVDLMDASGSFLPRVRDLVGRNPVILIGTKVNPLPSSCARYDLSRYSNVVYEQNVRPARKTPDMMRGECTEQLHACQVGRPAASWCRRG